MEVRQLNVDVTFLRDVLQPLTHSARGDSALSKLRITSQSQGSAHARARCDGEFGSLLLRGDITEAARCVCVRAAGTPVAERIIFTKI